MTRGQRGYTIVEALLFLAISAAMFSIGFVGLRGQQDSVAFRQAVNDVDLKIKEIFNNVDNGYFGNIGQYRGNCTLPNTYDWIVLDSTGGGNSNGCVFRGKLIVFTQGSENLTIATLISNIQYTATAHFNQLEESYILPQSLKITKVQIVNNITHVVETTNEVKLASVLSPADEDGNPISSDLRALKYARGDGTWFYYFFATDLLSNERNIKICFAGRGKIGSITISQKASVVDYNGGGC